MKRMIDYGEGLSYNILMPYIQLNNRKGLQLQTLLDDADYEQLKGFSWHMNSYGYAQRCVAKRIAGKREAKTFSMAREIMKAPSDLQVDHINHDKLDNRKENLRLCSQAENLLNKPFNNGKNYLVKGVYYRKGRRQWYVVLEAKGIRHYVGSYLSQIEAICAYNKAAKKYHGEFAYLNPIPENDVFIDIDIEDYPQRRKYRMNMTDEEKKIRKTEANRIWKTTPKGRSAAKRYRLKRKMREVKLKL